MRSPETLSLELNLITLYNEDVSTTGQVSLILHGESTSKFLTLSQTTKNLKLELVTFYDFHVPTKGKINLTLHGTFTTHFIIFDETEFKKYQKLVIRTDFFENVSNVTVMWESGSKKPLQLINLKVTVDNDQVYNFEIRENIKNGLSKKFRNPYKTPYLLW